MKSKIFIFFIFSVFLLSNFSIAADKKSTCALTESCTQNFTVTNACLNLSSTVNCLKLSNNSGTDKVSLVVQAIQDPKNSKFKYAIFDICKSFWKKSLYDLLYAYQKQKGVSLSYYFTMAKFGVSYAFGTLDPKKAYEAFLQFCKGTTTQEMKNSCLQLWEHECKNSIFTQAKELFEKHKKEGATLILTEAGFKELYDEFCAVFKFDYCCTSQLEFKDGKITGKLVGEPCSGKEKLEQVKKLIEDKLGGSLSDAVFYANSHKDIPLLEKAGKPIAVNPDSELETYAKKKGWQILKFS